MLQAIRNGYRRSAVDRVWRELTDTQNPSTSPFILAVGYNSLANNGTMIIPTMKADSVNVEEDVFSANSLANLKEVLKVDRVTSPQLAWLSADTEWLGYATTEDIFAEDDKERTTPIGKQIEFAGASRWRNHDTPFASSVISFLWMLHQPYSKKLRIRW